MRILHVTNSYLPRLGGIELHVRDLAERQRAAGDDVLVVTAERDPRGTASPGIVRIPTTPGAIGARPHLVGLMRQWRPDVVHAHLSVVSPFAWAALRAAAHDEGAARVATLHSMLPAHPGLVRHGLRRSGIGTDLAFAAVSRVAADRLAAALPPAVSVTVLPNGIDPAMWRVGHVPDPTFRILVVGRLAARKRPLVALDALSRLRGLAPDLRWQATFVGDGPQRRQLEDLIRRRDLADQVRTLGPQPRETIRHHLARTDVLLCPASLESFGIAALEARCAGVPIVAMAGSGVTEFVRHGSEGLLVSGDADLAPTLLYAADPRVADHLRATSTTTPTGLEWSVILERHAALHRAAMTAQGRGVLRCASRYARPSEARPVRRPRAPRSRHPAGAV
ncbi:glycosyltransferase family 4 protein [Nocardioides fonticola]